MKWGVIKMATKVKAIPKEGLTIKGIEPKQKRGNGYVNLDLSAKSLTIMFNLKNGFNPTPYLDETLGLGRNNAPNLMFLLFTNKVEPDIYLNWPKLYLLSPNGNFFHGITFEDDPWNSSIHILNEIAFPIDRGVLKEREGSFPDKRPSKKDNYLHADSLIYRVKNFYSKPNTEVILPIRFGIGQNLEVRRTLEEMKENMQKRGYALNQYYIRLASRAGELEGIGVWGDASISYSPIKKEVGISITPMGKGLGGVGEVDLATIIQKNIEYLTPFLNFVN